MYQTIWTVLKVLKGDAQAPLAHSGFRTGSPCASQRLALRTQGFAKARLAPRKGSPCAMAPKVKKRSAALPHEESASYSMMARCSEGHGRMVVARAVKVDTDRETPYGRLLKKMDLELVDGTTCALQYACPFAFLYTACTESMYFFPFLITYSCAEIGRLCFYLDEHTTREHSTPRSGARVQFNLLGCVQLSRLVSSKAVLLVRLRARA